MCNAPEQNLAKLKRHLGNQVRDYDRLFKSMEMDCSENLAVYLSSTLGTKVLAIIKTIEELKKLEMEINGTIPLGLQKGEAEFRSKLVV
jgi:hypothetical protein